MIGQWKGSVEKAGFVSGNSGIGYKTVAVTRVYSMVVDQKGEVVSGVTLTGLFMHGFSVVTVNSTEKDFAPTVPVT